MKKSQSNLELLLVEAACKRCHVTGQEKSELMQVQTTPQSDLPLLLGDVRTKLGLDFIGVRLGKED
jgi:hypothetical protein